MEQFHSVYYKTNIGILRLSCTGKSIVSLNIVSQNDLYFKVEDSMNTCSLCKETLLQLQQYFSKNRKQFSLPLYLCGSQLQNKVWNYLLTIPYGKVITYSEVAESVSCKSIRAVGTAIGKNPIPIIIPCHRVIRKDGTIGEYSMGGSPIKQYLLNLEANN